jgi:hypothetical protein
MRTLLPAALFLLAAAGIAAISTKPPWEWTIDERLADRFDPAKIQERELAYRSKFPQSRGGHGKVVYVIDGARNPELFLPSELFDVLLRKAFAADEAKRAAARTSIRPALAPLAQDEKAFWDKLEAITAKYVTMKFGFAGSDPDARCRARYDALEAAREAYGRYEFDRFLYTVFAPAMSSSEATSDPDPAARRRREENGCR